MEIKIVRTDDSFTSQELKERLESLPSWDNSITLEVRERQHQPVRTVDPTILAAILASPVIAALISGLLTLNTKEKIVLVTKDGLRIEVEARHAQEKIPELIKLLRSMEVEIIRI